MWCLTVALCPAVPPQTQWVSVLCLSWVPQVLGRGEHSSPGPDKVPFSPGEGEQRVTYLPETIQLPAQSMVRAEPCASAAGHAPAGTGPPG